MNAGRPRLRHDRLSGEERWAESIRETSIEFPQSGMRRCNGNSYGRVEPTSARFLPPTRRLQHLASAPWLPSMNSTTPSGFEDACSQAVAHVVRVHAAILAEGINGKINREAGQIALCLQLVAHPISCAHAGRQDHPSTGFDCRQMLWSPNRRMTFDGRIDGRMFSGPFVG